MDEARLAELSGILFFITGAFIFVLGGLITAKFIRPSRPNEEKNTIYESGEESQGSAWTNFNVRFYIIALVFVLFEVEMVFLFPWATIFGQQDVISQVPDWGWFTMIEMFTFIFILVLGLVYAWKKGFLDWVKPIEQKNDFKGVVPNSLYDNLNKKYAKKTS